MRAHFGLPSVSNEEDKKDKPPITVKFEIPYFTVSGIQVRYLKIIGEERLPGAAVGEVHYAKWRLPAARRWCARCGQTSEDAAERFDGRLSGGGKA